MAGTDRTDKLTGFETLGLLTGTRRAGDWSGPLPEITGLAVDSRDVRAGSLFAALPGSRMHGAEFIPYALRMGAVAVLTDPAGLEKAEAGGGPLAVPVVLSDNPRHTLAIAASRYFGSQPEVMVAVTGTNGKTSVASFTRQIWEALGEAAVNFGTVGVEGAVAGPLTHTTPEPITLHRLLGDLADKGITHAAMEASSHGLDQGRLDGVHLAAAGVTNITRDHLD
jgi:UDP-N-acetylmuramoyl-L-alanyl-D-glutamate--2,6-diaminopimelate ligase